jgi:hypothetical protein
MSSMIAFKRQIMKPEWLDKFPLHCVLQVTQKGCMISYISVYWLHNLVMSKAVGSAFLYLMEPHLNLITSALKLQKSMA